jgi:hypothetical protein
MHIGRLLAVCSVAMVLICIACTGCLGAKTPPVSRPIAPAIFLDYHRSGGIACFDDRLVVFDNGAAIVATKKASREIVLNATEIDRISGLFTIAQFSMLQTNYPAPHGSVDLIQYSVSYHGKTVATEDSAIPPALQPVIDEMDRIVKDAGE